MKNTVFFDFDGTIVNCQKFQIFRLKEIMLNHNVDVSNINFLDLIGPPLVNTFSKYIKDATPQEVLEEYNKTFDPQKINGIFLFDGIEELLINLKQIGYNIVIVSLQFRDIIMAQLKYLGIDNLISAVYCDSPETAYKSKSEIVQKLLLNKTFNKEEVLLVGDTVNDVLAGRENDVDTVGVNWGYGNIKPEEVTYLVDDTMQLFSLLNRLKSGA